MVQSADPTRFFILKVGVDGQSVDRRGTGLDLLVTDDDSPLQQAIDAVRMLQRLRPHYSLQLVDQQGRLVWRGRAAETRGTGTC
jgi:hypothetical protein